MRRYFLAGSSPTRWWIVAFGSPLPARCTNCERRWTGCDPDIVIIDLATAADRRDVLRLVRTVGAPLIATSVRDPALRVELLFTGADDCLLASFAPEELTARIIRPLGILAI